MPKYIGFYLYLQSDIFNNKEGLPDSKIWI